MKCSCFTSHCFFPLENHVVFSRQTNIFEENIVTVLSEGILPEPSYVPSAYLAEIRQLHQAVCDVDVLLNSLELQVKDFEDFSKQDACLKVGALE